MFFFFKQAAILVTVGANYTGAKANINVWNPNVESEDFTTAQIWLKAGPNDNFESVESGWTVSSDPNLKICFRLNLIIKRLTI